MVLASKFDHFKDKCEIRVRGDDKRRRNAPTMTTRERDPDAAAHNFISCRFWLDATPLGPIKREDPSRSDTQLLPDFGTGEV
ncbi:hypothetical protein OUZ56_004682 [Daphnia magna]|uniref:Uncharacterized protein n=1 Tax=Daphnia magna TaxID=35525 RepID=A0ABQ9YQJ3_9CRUS|nr:hypothetical protein OUZ56_004682 [Daphnia magna]